MAQHKLTLQKTLTLPELINILTRVEFRSLYDKKGERLTPYTDAKFSLATVYPSEGMGMFPIIEHKKKRSLLYSPQPTIYQNQLDIMGTIDEFLKREKMNFLDLQGVVEYEWAERGIYHVLPPIIEKHSYDLANGFFDLQKLTARFQGCYTKDALGNLHDLSQRYLHSFFIDEISKLDYLDIFHSNAPLINYGLQFSGVFDFYIVCDGMHRIDYAIETLGKPITVLVAESTSERLLPYYAFPFPFHPTIRLSSKRSERMYPRLERDKVHLFNDFIKKILHYDWTRCGLNVSSLRTQTEIY